MEKLNFGWLIEREIAGHREPASDEELRYLKDYGVGALLRLVATHSLQVTPEQVARVGFTEFHSPVPDFGTPTIPQIEQILDFIGDSIAKGRAVGVCCGQGYGRTGTILACYLVNKSWAADKAIWEVRSKRPGSVETPKQEEAIRLFAERHQARVDKENRI
ncbi:dual specificity protein phosphatase family protein [Chloroflexota bacterium]